MDDKMTVVDLTDFIDHALAFAEAVEDDIRNGDKYTSATVVKLSKFMTIAGPVMDAMAAAIPNKNSLQ